MKKEIIINGEVTHWRDVQCVTIRELRRHAVMETCGDKQTKILEACRELEAAVRE